MRVNFNLHIASGKNYPSDHAVVPSDTIMEASPTLRFNITYPLTKPFEFNQTHGDGRGWTQVEFVEALRQSYVRIYESEPDPGHVPGMLNRSISQGPYGIWGHDLSDLFLEGAVRLGDGSWTLLVGS